MRSAMKELVAAARKAEAEYMTALQWRWVEGLGLVHNENRHALYQKWQALEAEIVHYIQKYQGGLVP